MDYKKRAKSLRLFYLGHSCQTRSCQLQRMPSLKGLSFLPYFRNIKDLKKSENGGSSTCLTEMLRKC